MDLNLQLSWREGGVSPAGSILFLECLLRPGTSPAMRNYRALSGGRDSMQL
jgi:hypothetical protein